MTIALITPPQSEPLSLDDIKLHLRIDHDHEDALLVDVLKAARQYCEHASGQKLITQAWRQYETVFPHDRAISLLVAPVQSVAAVTAFDRDGNPSVLGVDDFTFQSRWDPQAITIGHDLDPSIAANGFEVDLVAGMGDMSTDVPDTLKRAILLLVAHWYEFRGAVSPQDQPVSIPAGFETMVRPWKGPKL